MLVLSRKVGEGIIVRDTETGETLSVRLLHIAIHDGVPSHVRLGIEASQRFNIVREEIDNRCQPDKTADT
ncbi:MAG: carbon storage regulator [Phycisphaerae bacterium]